MELVPSSLAPTTSIPSFIQQQVPLSSKNWFGTGGNARFYAEPVDITQFSQALLFAKQHALPICIVGSGANMLISDDGFDGLVIHPLITTLTFVTEPDGTYVRAGAGITIDALITFCFDNGYRNLEEFSGIPGTVGGAVYINVHYFEFLISQFLHRATVIECATGAIYTVDNNWFNFGYNQSTLQNKQFYLVDASFRVQKSSPDNIAFARGRAQEIIRHRITRYPIKNTCGSFFRNFLPHEVTVESNGKKMIYIAFYLDKLGIKGTLSHGDAIVSHQHANMIVNRGNGTSADIIALARRMQELVHGSFGIVPQPECELIGFASYPLLKKEGKTCVE
ncbi:MAG: UDP-N-acetylmuramate dehydrogenase [Candidatus Babeliales bacterium]